MEESAEILGKDESEVKEWNRRYESLKKAINEHFWLEERKMYASWEYPQYMGSPVADKVDVIANGYALLSDVASGYLWSRYGMAAEKRKTGFCHLP